MSDTAHPPWTVKAVTPEARNMANFAARRAGLSVGPWLTRAIQDQAQNEAQASRAIVPIAPEPAPEPEPVSNVLMRKEPPAGTVHTWAPGDLGVLAKLVDVAHELAELRRLKGSSRRTLGMLDQALQHHVQPYLVPELPDGASEHGGNAGVPG